MFSHHTLDIPSHWSLHLGLELCLLQLVLKKIMLWGFNVKRKGRVPYARPGLVIDNQSAKISTLPCTQDNSRDDSSTFNNQHTSPYLTCGPDSMGTVAVTYGED